MRPGRLKPCRVSILQESINEFQYSSELQELERIPQAELVLPIRCVGCSLAGHFSKRAAGWVYVGIVPVWVVQIIESLSSENQLMILMAGDDMEALLKSSIEALEAWAVNNVAGVPRCKRTRVGGMENARIEPLCVAGRAEFMGQGWSAGVHVILIA
jgi:hypothetical protein